MTKRERDQRRKRAIAYVRLVRRTAPNIRAGLWFWQRKKFDRQVTEVVESAKRAYGFTENDIF